MEVRGDSDSDLLIDLGQHGFDFQSSQSGRRKGAGKQVFRASSNEPSPGSVEPGDGKARKNQGDGGKVVIDLLTPEPPARTAPRVTTETADRRGTAGKEVSNSCVQTIDLCTTSESDVDRTRESGQVLEEAENNDVSLQDRAKSKRRPTPNVLSPEFRRSQIISEADEAAAPTTAAPTTTKKRSGSSEVERAAKQARREAIKRSRGDFALSELTVLVSTEAIEHANLAGLKVCECVKAQGMSFEVKTDLPLKGVPTIFWRTSRDEASPSQGDGRHGGSESLVPCLALLFEASEFIAFWDDTATPGRKFLNLLSSIEASCPRFAIYCVLIGWERELSTRERKFESFSPIKYEMEIANLLITTRGLEFYKTQDVREAAEYLAALSAEVARLPYLDSESAVGDFCKKVKPIFQGSGGMSVQKRAWINMIHQLPQVGAAALRVLSPIGSLDPPLVWL